MCWEGWNPDWDTKEWFDRVVDARNSGKRFTQDQVWEAIRRDHENRQRKNDDKN